MAFAPQERLARTEGALRASPTAGLSALEAPSAPVVHDGPVDGRTNSSLDGAEGGPVPPVRDPEFVERVLELVERIPPGRVTTYGAIGDAVGRGPRLIRNVMARHGAGVPWWRVVRADGSLPPSHGTRARTHYDDERTPTLPSGRIDVRSAFWDPVASERD